MLATFSFSTRVVLGVTIAVVIMAEIGQSPPRILDIRHGEKKCNKLSETPEKLHVL